MLNSYADGIMALVATFSAGAAAGLVVKEAAYAFTAATHKGRCIALGKLNDQLRGALNAQEAELERALVDLNAAHTEIRRLKHLDQPRDKKGHFAKVVK